MEERESRVCGRLSVIYIHIDAWEKLATFLRGHRHHSPCPIFNPPLLFFHRPPLATSRIFAGHKYKKFAGTNRPATIYCIWVLGFVNRGNVPLSCNRRPTPPSRASVSSPVRSRGSRSGATYFPGTNAMNQTACPRHECSSADIRSVRLLDIVHFSPLSVSIQKEGMFLFLENDWIVFIIWNGWCSLRRGKKTKRRA